MLTVYFIRHGQAGSRQDYDRLSPVGQEQARQLGEWLARQPVRFDQAWSGRLQRQKETASVVRNEYQRSGASFPEVCASQHWDEFDLDAVYRGIGPQLAGDDEEFREQFAELERQAMDPASRIHRAWAQCDTTVVRNWIEGKYQYQGESFAAFVARVRSASLEDPGHERHVAVFTSATPIAVWVAKALELDGLKVMQLAGVTYNTSVTVMRIYPERLRLFQFNSTPHLEGAELLTHR